jgi:hypothetical protein
MDTQTISFSTFKKAYAPAKVFYVNQERWVWEDDGKTGATTEMTDLYAAQKLGDMGVINMCSIKTNEVEGYKLISDNLCESEKDALALAVSVV